MSYYDFTITQIPVGDQDEPEFSEKFGDVLPIHVQAYSTEQWRASWSCCSGGGAFLELSDNGKCGDGIRFQVKGHCKVDGKDMVAVDFNIPDESLPTIIEALTAIQRLRATEEKA